MRRSVAALALIRLPDPPRFLVQWNSRWQRYSLVGGHVEPGESFHEAIVREVHEELELTAGRDVEISDPPLARVEFVAHSRSAAALTRYEMELFEVRPSEAAIRRFSSDPRNAWITPGEIQAGQSTSGKPIDASVERLLAAAGILNSTTGE